MSQTVIRHSTPGRCRAARVARPRRLLTAATAAPVVAISLVVMSVAPETRADGPVARGYATPSVSGTSDDWTGSIAPPSSPIGFPTATLTSNARTLSTASSATLTGSSPFGDVFGTSSGATYLTVRNSTGGAMTTTTITFAAPTPSQNGNNGWGFTLGDIDADKVTLTATGTGGAALTGAQLGFQGVFNYASGQTDVPTWDEATRTLTGSRSDTSGASGWFRPTAPITTLTLEFTALSGGPLFQMWIAAIGDRTISGTVTECVDGAVVPDAGATVALLDVDSNPVTSGGSPVTATTGADGTYSFTGLLPSQYRIGLDDEVAVADVTSANASDIDLGCTTPPTTTTSTTTTTTPPAPTTTEPAPTTTPTTTTPAPTPTTTPVPPPPPGITIDIVNPPSGDNTVVAGGSIIASVEGCVPPEVVTFTLGTQRLGGICRECDDTRSGSGCCTVELQAPSVPGTYVIEAVFTESRPGEVLRSQTITVIDAPTTTRPGGGLPGVGQNTEQMSALPIALIALGLIGVLLAANRRRHI